MSDKPPVTIEEAQERFRANNLVAAAAREAAEADTRAAVRWGLLFRSLSPLLARASPTGTRCQGKASTSAKSPGNVRPRNAKSPGL